MNFSYLIVLIIIKLFLFTSYQTYLYSKLLTGYWESNDEFNSQANLKTFALYIGPIGYLNFFIPTRTIYLLIVNDKNDVIMNRCMSASISYEKFIFGNWNPLITGYRELNIYFSDIDEIANKSFPAKQSMRFYLQENKLVLYHGSTVTAVLHKRSIK